MKIFAAYCLLIGLLGGFGVKQFLLNEMLASRLPLVCGMKEEKKQESKGNCCKKETQEKKEAQKEKGCNPERDDKGCNNNSDCSRNCCSTVTVFFQNIVYDYPFPGIHKMYSTLIQTQLPDPYLVKITPPPNC
jgi:hypothetical protein